MNSPQAKRIKDEIVHGTFVKEGTMVAFQLCFPEVSLPIASDESHITALDVTDDGVVYGGTSGKATHLFVGMFNGVTGMVFDMGTVDGADKCAAICCGTEKFVACVNGTDGGRIVMRKFEELPFDLIQEWGFFRERFEDLGRPVEGERIIHAVRDCSRRFVVGVTEGHLFLVDIDKAKVEVVGEVPGAGRLAIGSNGNVFGMDEGDSLWRYELEERKLTRKAIQLPKGNWQKRQLMWARDNINGRLYTADDDGNIFSFTEQEGFAGPLGQAKFAPVGPMAVTFDGRIFGFCGDEISNMFCYNPDTGEINDIGAVVSVIERRRYGYVFADAVVGRDGQIFFGEDDDLGHLWIYFPAIERHPGRD